MRLYWSHESKRLETKFGHTHASHPDVTISLRVPYFIRGDALLIFIECYLVPAPFIRTISFCIRTELEENIYYKDIKQSQKKRKNRLNTIVIIAKKKTKKKHNMVGEV